MMMMISIINNPRQYDSAVETKPWKYPRLQWRYWRWRYNFAADSFYIMKLRSRLFVLYCRNCTKNDKFRYFIPILRKLGAA